MVGSRHAAVVAALVGFGLWTASERAHACSPIPNMVLQVGSDQTGEAPSGISGASATMSRGEGSGMGGCGRGSASCDDMGSFQVHFTAATDGDSPPRSVGYRVEVIAGAAPGYSMDEYEDRALLPQLDSDDQRTATLYFHWDDGATNDQENVDFTITLTPVDANGNEGPTSGPIRIRDDGGGCSVGERGAYSSRTAPSTALLAVAAAFARRRSKRSRAPSA